MRCRLIHTKSSAPSERSSECGRQFKRATSIRWHRHSHAELAHTVGPVGSGPVKTLNGRDTCTRASDRMARWNGEEAQCGSETETESSVRDGQLDHGCRCRLLGTILVGIHGDRSYLAGPELAHRRYSAKKTLKKMKHQVNYRRENIMSEIARLERIVHVVIAKPIAWTIYGIWQGLIWAGRSAIGAGKWAQTRWAEYRARREARKSAPA